MYVDGWISGYLSKPPPSDSRDWLFNPKSCFEPEGLSYRHLEDWSEVVERYSARSLTFPSDKLPALSAIAEKFGPILSDSYVAGMWKNALRFNLSWIRKELFPAPLIARPSTYQAPSWSWASVNGTVQLSSPQSYNRYPKFLLQILHYKVELADVTAPYGAVTSGVLTVKGRMKQIQWVPNEDDVEGDFGAFRAFRTFNVGSDMPPIWIHQDAFEEVLPKDGGKPTPVFALEMAKYCTEYTDNSVAMRLEGLLLCKSQATNEISVYRRVGLFETSAKPVSRRLPEESDEKWRLRNYESLMWFDECEPQVITII